MYSFLYKLVIRSHTFISFSCVPRPPVRGRVSLLYNLSSLLLPKYRRHKSDGRMKPRVQDYSCGIFVSSLSCTVRRRLPDKWNQTVLFTHAGQTSQSSVSTSWSPEQATQFEKQKHYLWLQISLHNHDNQLI